MFSALEIFALVVIAVALIKLIFILIKPRAWINFAGKLYTWPVLTIIISLAAAGFVLNALIIAGITIIQIFAVMLFVALLSASMIAVYAKDFMLMAMKLVKDRKFLKKAWLPILVWLALIIWAIMALFA